MEAMGLERFRSKVAYARSKGRMTDLPSGRVLFRECMVPFTAAVTEWRQNFKAQWQGHLTHHFGELPTEFVCALAARVIIDGVCRSHSFHNIAYTIGAHIEDERIVRQVKKEEKTLWHQLIPKFKYAGEDRRRTYMRRLRSDWKKQGKHFPALCMTEKLEIGVALTLMFSECTGVITISGQQNRGRRATKFAKVDPTPELLKWLEDADNRHELLKPVFLPLLKKPFPWQADFSGGYSADLSIRTPFCKALDRKFAKGLYVREQMPEVFDAVNRIQETPWAISPVHQVAQAVWEEGHAVAGLPRREDEVVPDRPDTEDEEVLKNHKQMARLIHQDNRAQRSKRLQVMKTLWTAGQYADQVEMYFPHQLDFRGRAYPIPLFLNPQGTDLSKGLLRFAEPSELSPETRGPWAIQGANTWGLDKAPFEERISWVEDNWLLISKIRKDPLAHREWMDADKPWQFLNWCMDDPSAPQVPVCADGTNNGLQVIAALTGDAETAFHTNLIKSDRPQDIYAVVAKRATELLVDGLNLEDPKSVQWAHDWLCFWGHDLPRSAVKRQVMTQPYGSTKHSCTDYTLEAFRAHESYYRELWPNDQFARVRWLSDIIWQAITDCLKGPRAFMDWAAACAKEAAKAGVYLRWHLPTEFQVSQRYRKRKSRQISSWYGWKFNLEYMTREWLDEVDPRKTAQSTPANVVHSIDAAAMMRTVNLAHDAGVREFAMVHDDFGTSAAHAPTLSRCTREAYVQILSEVSLEGLHREWSALCEGQGVKLPPPPPRGPFEVREILDSPYFFS